MNIDSGASSAKGSNPALWGNFHEDLRQALIRFFNVMYPVGIAFGGIAVVTSIIGSAYYEQLPALPYYVGIYLTAVAILLLRRRLPVLWLFYGMLVLIAMTGILSFWFMGIAGKGLMSLVVLCTFAVVFLGIRAGIIVAGAGTLVVSLIGAGICVGFITTKPYLDGYVSAPAIWAMHISSFLMYIVPLMLAVNGTQQKTAATVNQLRDINERLGSEIQMRTEAEKDLRESGAKYRTIFEHAVEGIFRTTLEGKLEGINPSLARMAGFRSPEEMATSDYNHERRFWANPGDRDRLIELLQDRGYVSGFEVEMGRKDGTAMWISMNVRAVRDEEGRILVFEGSAEDISKRKAAENALQESEAKYRSVVESSLVASYIVQDGVFRFANARFCTLSGYRYEELVDKLNPFDLVHPDDREKMRLNFAKRLSGEDMESEYQIRVIRKDRKILTIKLFGSSFIFNGKPAAFGMFIDVTKEVSLESQLRQAQKMEAIGTLAGGIAHDFNNILTVLMGYGTLLQMKMEQTNPLRLYADQILSASQKASSLTQSLLAFGRQQPITLKPQNINAVVRGTESLLKRLITEDIGFTTDLAPEEMVVMADSTQIDQILFNLVTNARDAMSHGGLLRIATNAADLDRDFTLVHGFGETGRYAHLAVTDTGAGMDERTKGKIFDPFFTTKGAGKGTGLGLSTVYGIVKQHNGYITVESEPGKGTAFHIYLPIVKIEAYEEPVPLAHTRRMEKTILIAEDEQQVRLLLKDILGQQGYTVIEAVDGSDAVEKFKEHQEISLVIIDSVMPKKNGKEAYDAMERIRPGVPALFMSGYNSDVILGKGIQEHRFDFIAKPLSPDDLLSKLEQILDRTT
jgi:two-component system, cell cycle sensor histidine kinase and response regulator CckA